MQQNRKRNQKRLYNRRDRRQYKRGTVQSGNLAVRDNPRFPNDIKQLPIQQRKMRYILTAATTDNTMTPATLLNWVGATTNLSAVYIPLCRAIRILGIDMYFVPTTGDLGNTASVISFSWSGLQNAPDNNITDRGTAFQPACIKVRPPKDSVAAMWFESGSSTVANALFKITAPQYTIIDLHFEYVLADGATTAVTLTGSATVTGVQYLTLKGSSTLNMVPDGGLNTVAY